MKSFLATTVMAGVTLLAGASSAHAVSYPAGFEEHTLIAGLNQPTAVAWAPNGRAFVTEKAGVVKTAAPGSSSATTIVDLRNRVNSYWDRGLLGLAVDSQFQSNGYLYLLYTYERLPLTPDSNLPMVSQLVRLKLNQQNAPVEEKVLLGSYTSTACPSPQNGVDCIPSDHYSHSIGTVRSAADGSLWVGSGDGASWTEVDNRAFRAYDEQSMAGKILHVDREGRGLPGHAFCPGQVDTRLVCTKLHAKGFRNPFRFTLRPGGGLAVGDVGWNVWEELNLVGAAGKSYGWPCYEGGARTPGYKDHANCPAEYAKEGTAGAHVGPSHSYQHTGQGGATVAGPTYEGDTYPAGHRGSIFFGDYALGFLKRLVVPASGPPQAVPFATGWSGVDLELTPGGNLGYVDLFAGSVKEIVYAPGNTRPIAVAEATPTFGDTPLTVSFDGSESSDADHDQLRYDWDFGDGSPHSSSVSPSHIYRSPGTYTARLTVSDGRGKSDTDTVQIGVGHTPPTASIQDAPTYRGGRPVTVHGSAGDEEDGPPPASAYSWSVKLVHNQHFHFVGDYNGVRDVTFTPTTDHDADSHYEVTLTVTDSQGLTATDTVLLQPETAPLRLLSEPAGVLLSYSGAEVTSPFVANAAIGFHTTITAPLEFAAGGRRYEFVDWSDGGARVHSIDIPASGLELEARYRLVPLPGLPVDLAPKLPAGARRDRSGPRLRFDPRRGIDLRRGLVSGSAFDPAGVRFVQVALERRLRSGSCRWWLASRGALSGRPRSCARPAWIKARLRGAGNSRRWRASLRWQSLPPGKYRLRFRAGDRLGNKTRTLSDGQTSVLLRVLR